jgi:hypothetical protein
MKTLAHNVAVSETMSIVHRLTLLIACSGTYSCSLCSRTPFACHETCPLVVRSLSAAGRVGRQIFLFGLGRGAAWSPGWILSNSASLGSDECALVE